MGIKSIDENLRTKYIGKVRMGVMRPGTSFPMDVEHFAVHDAPDVEKVYGSTPKRLEVIFAGATIDEAVPYWYKFWSGGSKDKEGNLIGGKINCQGDGVTADHFAARDPVTRIVPKRQCLGAKCVDWDSSNGNPQCRPQMTLKFYIPRANPLGYFEIDTKSLITINNVLGILKPIQDKGFDLRGIPFIMERSAVKTEHVGKDGKLVKSTHWPLTLQPIRIDSFEAQFGKEISHQIRSFTMSAHLEQRPVEQLEAPEDVSPVTTIDVTPSIDSIKLIAEDADLAPLFAELAPLLKKQNTDKLRLITARQFEKEADPKAKLQSYLLDKIKAAKPKETPATTPSGPQPNADGLI